MGGVGDKHFAEGALNVREGHGRAVKAHVQAMVRQALQAILAGAAGAGGRDGDEVAQGEAMGTLAEGGDVAGDFVAEDHGFFEADRAEAAVVEIVQVRAADAAGSEADLDLTGAGGFFSVVFKAQIARGVDCEGFHRWP